VKLNTQGLLTPTPQTATGASANSIKMGLAKNRAMVFTFWNTAGSVSPQLEINCTGQATGWALVGGSALTLAVETKVLDVVYPGCEYRVNVPTTCTGCSLNVHYYALPEL